MTMYCDSRRVRGEKKVTNMTLKYDTPHLGISAKGNYCLRCLAEER